MQYEPLVAWARETWETRSPGRKYVTVWASTECSNMLAHMQVKPGRRLRGKARYVGLEMLDCPLVTQISDYGARGKKMVLTSTAGAFAFKFTQEGEPFEVIYASAYFNGDVQNLNAIALVPEECLEAWAAFEFACTRAVRPRIKRRRDMYVIGGADAFSIRPSIGAT